MAKWFGKKEPQVEVRQTLEDILLAAGVGTNTITASQAMTIPAFSSSVHLISNTVASLPIKLYKTEGDRIEEIYDDPRVALLNKETGDTLDGFQLKKGMVTDFLTYGGGYAFINKSRNKVKSIHYVSRGSVSVVSSPDPVFKRNDILVNGVSYRDYEFIKLLRNTANGGTGFGVLAENNKMLSLAYNTILFEEMLYKTGGNKKGFLLSKTRLSPNAMTELKNAWNNLHKNNSENVIVLNDGLEFKESNNSAVEMQVNQNKISNNQDIFNMFGIPIELFNGKATGGNEEMYASFVKLAILPLLEAFEAAINATMLLTNEKDKLVFRFDVTPILTADIEKRYKAYEIAIKNGLLQIDEIRKIEKYEPLGLDFVKLSLADALYNPKTKDLFVLNTNSAVKLGEGGIEQVNDPNASGKPSAKGENPKADSTSNPKEVKKNES
ncbi:phage portal protein [Paenibacillus sp. OV219]|uniref:phage portal protein n=1 Tax=Paenibacillus sp. OV219 TaxID=1884377 RepID=UPI0008AAD44C|nr:phage portal protein [Paenibacillus sp. OV219]SEN18926.1 phage portal protein, HK97 family [Paenibacillus sp. OV219]